MKDFVSWLREGHRWKWGGGMLVLLAIQLVWGAYRGLSQDQAAVFAWVKERQDKIEPALKSRLDALEQHQKDTDQHVTDVNKRIDTLPDYQERINEVGRTVLQLRQEVERGR